MTNMNDNQHSRERKKKLNQESCDARSAATTYTPQPSGEGKRNTFSTKRADASVKSCARYVPNSFLSSSFPPIRSAYKGPSCSDCATCCA
jgi:hypothetical protein